MQLLKKCLSYTFYNVKRNSSAQIAIVTPVFTFRRKRSLPLSAGSILHVLQCQVAIASAERESGCISTHARILRWRPPLGIVKRGGKPPRPGGASRSPRATLAFWPLPAHSALYGLCGRWPSRLRKTEGSALFPLCYTPFYIVIFNSTNRNKKTNRHTKHNKTTIIKQDKTKQNKQN